MLIAFTATTYIGRPISYHIDLVLIVSLGTYIRYVCMQVLYCTRPTVETNTNNVKYGNPPKSFTYGNIKFRQEGTSIVLYIPDFVIGTIQ